MREARRGRLCSILAVVGFLAACTQEPDPAEAGMGTIAEGEPCAWPGASCVDERDLLWCGEGIWRVDACDAYCASLAPKVSSPGCDTSLGEGAPEQLCVCEPPAGGCYPGQGSCDSADTIRWCTEEWTWASSSCASVCAARSLLSRGCEAVADSAACLCTQTGTACTNEAPVCASATVLSVCEQGFWTEVDCAEGCGSAASCDPAAPGGAACECEA